MSLYWENYLASRKEDSDLYDPESSVDPVFIPPNFSYAGYHHGNLPLPNAEKLKNYRIFNVMDYGAIPNDDQSDRKAIKETFSAIRTYQTAHPGTGAVLYFPEGEFILIDASDFNSMDQTNHDYLQKNQRLGFFTSNFIIRGAGESKTTLLAKSHLTPIDSTKKWTTPFILQLGKDEALIEKNSAIRITSSAHAGSTCTLKVRNSKNLHAGDFVEIMGLITNPTKIKSAVYPYELETKDGEFLWKDLSEGLKRIERHQILSVTGNTIKLAAPISHNIDASDHWTVRKIFPAVEIGIEDLTISGLWIEDFEHHKNALHDSGYSLILFQNSANSWIRRVTFRNFNQAFCWLNSFTQTAEDINLTGTPGHSSFLIQYSNHNITKNLVDNSDAWHAPGFSKYSTCNVHLNMRYSAFSNIDLHGEQPTNNLLDNTSGGWANGRWGGAVQNLPNHLEGLIFWNHINTGNRQTKFQFMKNGTSYGRVIMPHLIGLRGSPVSVASQKDFLLSPLAKIKDTTNMDNFQHNKQAYIELQGQVVYPLSLYEAQLEYRLSLNKTDN